MKRSYSGYLYIVLCAIIFSTMEVMLKTVHGVFAPMQITCLRFLIGGILLIPFALRSMKKKGAAFTRADIGFFALTGFLCVAFSMVLYQMAVTHTKASVVAVIFSCNPIFVTVLASLLLHERIHRNHLIALALELLAVLIIIDPLHTTLDPVGITLVLLSAATFALYAVLGKKQCTQYSGVAVTCFSCLAASAEMIVLMLISHIPAVADALQAAGLPMFAAMPFFSGYTTGNLLNVLYICVFVTAGGYACYFMGMEATSAMQGSLVFFFKPVLAPILAMLILGEEIPWNMWAGIGLMLTESEGCRVPRQPERWIPGA